MEFYLCPEWVNEWVRGWLCRRGFAELHTRTHVGYFLSNLLLLALLPMIPLLPHICLVQALFGIPCPGCGVTHALLLALTLHFRESMKANPASLMVALTIGFQIVGRPWAIVDGRASTLVTRISQTLSSLSIVCLLAVWISILLKIAVSRFYF